MQVISEYAKASNIEFPDYFKQEIQKELEELISCYEAMKDGAAIRIADLEKECKLHVEKSPTRAGGSQEHVLHATD